MSRHAFDSRSLPSTPSARLFRATSRVLSVVMLATGLSETARAQPTYTPADLGTLGGTSLDSSVADGINSQGDVVGWSTIGGLTHAFLWTSGDGMRDLGTLGGRSSAALAINDLRQVVGWAEDAAGRRHAFLWTETTGMRSIDRIDPTRPLGTPSEAAAINNVGQIAGTIFSPAHSMFRWSPTGDGDVMTSLGGPTAFATGIDERGLVSCQAQSSDGHMRPCVISDRIFELLGEASASVVGGAFAISRNGRAVGADATSALAWGTSLVGTRLVTPGVPSDINDANQIVGTTGSGRGFVWREGESAIDLGASTGAIEINNSGEVVGHATVDGQRHATIWRRPLTSLMLEATPASPQRAGTPVRLRATASGGTAPLLYRFWVQPWGGDWQLLRDWAPGQTADWTPERGPGYNLWVQARETTATEVQVQTGINFEVPGGTGPGGPMTSVALTTDLTSPQPAGTTIKLTAIGTGGTMPYSFRFWVQPWGGDWQLLRDWTPAAVHNWTPTVPGGYSVWVQGRSVGSTATEVQTGINFEITMGSGGGGGGGGGTVMTEVTLVGVPTSPQPVGTPILWKAIGSGGTAPYMFRFWLQPWGGAWQVVQDWSPADSFAWLPTMSGGYNAAVEARSAGATAAQVQASANFFVTGP